MKQIEKSDIDSISILENISLCDYFDDDNDD